MSDPDIAKALYFRGVALERAGASAQAISDLTSALWLTGLESSQRARAYVNRALAYRDVGMDARANADLKQAKEIAPQDEFVAAVLSGKVGSSVQTAAPAMAPRSIPMPMMPGMPPGGLPGQRTALGPGARLPQVPVGNIPVNAMPKPAAAPQSQDEPKQVAAADPAPASPEPKPAAVAKPESEPAPEPESAGAPETSTPPAPAAAPTTPRAEFPSWATSVSEEAENEGGNQSGGEAEAEENEEPGRLRQFFGSLWGSDDDSDSSEGNENAKRAVVATAEWSKTTKVEEIDNVSSSGAGRSYRIQLASSRTEDEARSLWKRISTQYSAIVGDREPIIEKTELGTLGTFYRLQLGPFDDKRQSLQLCNSFKRSGVECFLVTR